MDDYRQAYAHYKQACEEHGFGPINSHYFILNLSQEQLDTFMAQKRGRDAVAI